MLLPSRVVREPHERLRYSLSLWPDVAPRGAGGRTKGKPTPNTSDPLGTNLRPFHDGRGPVWQTGPRGAGCPPRGAVLTPGPARASVTTLAEATSDPGRGEPHRGLIAASPLPSRVECTGAEVDQRPLATSRTPPPWRGCPAGVHRGQNCLPIPLLYVQPHVSAPNSPVPSHAVSVPPGR